MTGNLAAIEFQQAGFSERVNAGESGWLIDIITDRHNRRHNLKTPSDQNVVATPGSSFL
jgi:hypothetical protein